MPQTEEEKNIAASPNATVVSGERRASGTETYVEVKGPSGLGSRTKTPFSKVLPRYSKSAESALKRNEIPKNHQKRVKEYFESLSGGK